MDGDLWMDRVEIHIDDLMTFLNMDPNGVVQHVVYDEDGFVRVTSARKEPMSPGRQVARGGHVDIRSRGQSHG